MHVRCPENVGKWVLIRNNELNGHPRDSIFIYSSDARTKMRVERGFVNKEAIPAFRVLFIDH